MRKIVIFVIINCSSLVFAENIDISGFLSFAASKTDAKENFYYRNKINNKINFIEDSIVGLNFTSRISESLASSIQLLYKKQLDKSEHHPEVEMAFLRYYFSENIFIKMGIIKLPIWLISDYRNIGFLYPWVIPPEELYEESDSSENINGVNISYLLNFDNFQVELQALFGQSQYKLNFLNNFTNPVTGEIQDEYTTGKGNYKNVNISLKTSNMTFKLGYTNTRPSSEDYSILESNNYQTGETSTIKIKLGSYNYLYEFYSASLLAEFDKIKILSEIGRSVYKLDGEKLLTSMTEYITFVYKFNRIRPHFTILYGKTSNKNPSELTINATTTSTEPLFLPFETKVTSYTCGLNFILSKNSILKLQLKRINLYGNASYSFLYSGSYEGKVPFNLYSISINSIF